MEKPFKHISFDLDGTLINSFEVMELAWNECVKQFGLNIGFSKYRRLVGLPFPIIMKILKLEDLCDELSALYFSKTYEFRSKISLVDGAVDILENLRNQNLTTSIVTSKPREGTLNLIDMFNLNADLVIAGDDLKFGKPFTDAGIKICDTFDVLPKKVLYVGDMIFDFQFAHNCDFQFVHFTDNKQNKLPTNLINPIPSVDYLADFFDHVTLAK